MKHFILMMITLFIAVGCSKKSDSTTDATSTKTDHSKMGRTYSQKDASRLAMRLPRIQAAQKSRVKNFILSPKVTNFKQYASPSRITSYAITSTKNEDELYVGKLHRGLHLVAVTSDADYFFTFYGTSAGIGTLTSIDIDNQKESAIKNVYNRKIAMEKDGSLAFYKIGQSLNNKGDGTPNREIIKHLIKDGKITKTAVTEKVYIK